MSSQIKAAVVSIYTTNFSKKGHWVEIGLGPDSHVRVEGKEVTSQCVLLRQIIYSFTSMCVVSSHHSLGVQDKQHEVGYKVGPSRTLLSTERFPLVIPAPPSNGVRSQPLSKRIVWSQRVFVFVWEGVFVLVRHERASSKEKVRTRRDGMKTKTETEYMRGI